MCFSCYRTYVMILCNWLILWQNAFYLYLGRLRMCLTTSRNHDSRSSVEAFKSVQESSKSANSLKLDSWLIASQHLSIPGGSIEKAPISSTAHRQLLDSCIYRGLKLDTSSTPPDRSRLREFRFSDLIFGSGLCICVGFLFLQPQTYIRLILEVVTKENTRRTYAKGDRCLIPLKEATTSLRLRVL